MSDIGVIDRFVETFSTYIDSGFGLLGADVHFLTAVLIGIDITLAGLYWAMGPDTNVIAKFLKKVMYVGVFALIITNFSFLAGVIFDSFGALGLRASGSTLTAADLMRPGFVAATGFEAAHPLLNEVGELTGPVKFFTNIVTIFVLMLAWLITLFAFFFIAIQLFVTIIEFKLTTLAGFILIPFALWNKTSFLAEKVMGNIVASGIKLMVLAVIIGIGTTIFGELTAAFVPGEVTLEDAASVILGSLAIFALAIFGPGIATGLVSGAPQLGAGAAVGTMAAAGAGAYAAGAMGAVVRQLPENRALPGMWPVLQQWRERQAALWSTQESQRLPKFRNQSRKAIMAVCAAGSMRCRKKGSSPFPKKVMTMRLIGPSGFSAIKSAPMPQTPPITHYGPATVRAAEPHQPSITRMTNNVEEITK